MATNRSTDCKESRENLMKSWRWLAKYRQIAPSRCEKFGIIRERMNAIYQKA